MEANTKKIDVTMWIIIALLAAILVSNIFMIVAAGGQSEEYQTAIDDAQALIQQQQSTIQSLFNDYESLAYNNPSVDRIAEQQLLAAEFQLEALQIIALQNAQIIELLVVAP
jgi:hypothetical protein